MTHTPAPWETTFTTICGNVIAFKIVDQKHGSTKPICESCDGFTYEEFEANARLIAAAPDLLEALELLIEEIPTEIWESFPQYVQDKAITALSKAKGEL